MYYNFTLNGPNTGLWTMFQFNMHPRGHISNTKSILKIAEFYWFQSPKVDRQSYTESHRFYLEPLVLVEASSSCFHSNDITQSASDR